MAGNEHGLLVDPRGNVWVTGRGARDAQVLEFTSAGKFVLQIGKSGSVGSNNDPVDSTVRPMRSWTCRPTRSTSPTVKLAAPIAGSSSSMRRRAHKRHWGAYGEKPVDGPATPFDPKAPVSASSALRRTV